eukprot:5007028-Ditylum_brightwellii.AAC.1
METNLGGISFLIYHISNCKFIEAGSTTKNGTNVNFKEEKESHESLEASAKTAPSKFSVRKLSISNEHKQSNIIASIAHAINTLKTIRIFRT